MPERAHYLQPLWIASIYSRKSQKLKGVASEGALIPVLATHDGNRSLHELLRNQSHRLLAIKVNGEDENRPGYAVAASGTGS